VFVEEERVEFAISTLSVMLNSLAKTVSVEYAVPSVAWNVIESTFG